MPEKNEVSIDELIGTRKHISDDDGVLYKAHVSPRSWNDEERSASFVISAEVEDSYRDIVMQNGIDTKARFDSNPVAFFNHRSGDMPIGSWSDIRVVRSSPKRTEGKLTFTGEGVDETADRVARNVKEGVLRACSIGFRPKRAEKILDEDGKWSYGYRYNEVELYEVSVVTVPAVSQALIRSAGGGHEDIFSPEVIEEFLEHLSKHPEVARLVDKSSYEAVMREIDGNKTSLLVEAPMIEIKGLEQLEALTERMERAAGIEADPDEQREAEALDALEREIERAVAEIEPEAGELAETGKHGLSLIIDKIKSIFAPPEPVEPALASPEAKAAARLRLEAFEARHAS